MVLGITAVLARLRDVTSLAKTRKTVTCPGRKKNRKTAIIVDENRKPTTKFDKTRTPWKTPKPKNRSFQVRKPKTRAKHWPNPQNRKSNAPLVLACDIFEKETNSQGLQFMRILFRGAFFLVPGPCRLRATERKFALGTKIEGGRGGCGCCD